MAHFGGVVAATSEPWSSNTGAGVFDVFAPALSPLLGFFSLEAIEASDAAALTPSLDPVIACRVLATEVLLLPRSEFQIHDDGATPGKQVRSCRTEI
jgi:hypothetical protein